MDLLPKHRAGGLFHNSLFMEQIADHDHLNIVNQMDSKTEYLQVILDRIDAARDSQFEEVIYTLGVEARTTSFDTLYLITTDDEVYDSSYLKTSLQKMPWAEEFSAQRGTLRFGMMKSAGKNGVSSWSMVCA